MGANISLNSNTQYVVLIEYDLKKPIHPHPHPTKKGGAASPTPPSTLTHENIETLCVK